MTGPAPLFPCVIESKSEGGAFVDSMSELFKDMDEVRSFAESMRSTLSEEDYEHLLFLLGLRENHAVSDIVQLHGQDVKIDRSIAPMISDLNERGIITLASCSGMRCEHPEGRFRPESGYLSLPYDAALYEYLKSKLPDEHVSVTQSECYLKPAISIDIRGVSDHELEEEWSRIWKALRQWAEQARR